MNCKSFNHWAEMGHKNALLLFVQSLDELLFTYSFESYKLPALNSHFLCLDALQTIIEIEMNVLKDGNFIPLAEELEYELRNDIVIRNMINDSESIFYDVAKHGERINICNEDYKAKIKKYKTIAYYIDELCASSNQYLNTIKRLLIECILNDNFGFEVKNKIYVLTRILASELVNSGYSRHYIKNILDKHFYDENNPVLFEELSLDHFFNEFQFRQKIYSVEFAVNKPLKDILSLFDEFKIRDMTEEETIRYRQQSPKKHRIVEVSINDYDYYSASEKAKEMVKTIIALDKIGLHKNYLRMSSNQVVKEIEDEKTIAEFDVKNQPNLMTRAENLSRLHSLFNDMNLFNSQKASTFLRAASLHNCALESRDSSNQLLNLWTILELLIDIKKEGEDKINSISNILCAILNQSYIYSLIENILKDIKLLGSTIAMEIITNQSDLEDDVYKLGAILSVKNMEDNYNQLIDALSSSQLLVFRLQLFRENIFSSSQSIYKYILRHSNRLKWQIMRIYRNRNMIVHNGTSMPYIDIVIENLHYYVDSLMSTLIDYYFLNFDNHESIYKDIQIKETQYLKSIGVSFDRKKPNNEVDINENNFGQILFNDYKGREIKRYISSMKSKRGQSLDNS